MRSNDAVLLSAVASLRSGVGLTTVCVPEKGLDIIQTAVPEAMAWASNEGSYDLLNVPDIDPFDVVSCGPGMGTSGNALNFLRDLLGTEPELLVLDADALNLLARNRELLSILPENTILTPHPGEFRRLVGEWKDDYHKLELLREFSENYEVVTILKGAHTVVSTPSGELYFNSTGNSGMATAGSGDVLTGIITGLLGQLKDPQLAAVLGVYIHGLAGDLAAQELGEDALISSDIVAYLPNAIRAVTGI